MKREKYVVRIASASIDIPQVLYFFVKKFRNFRGVHIPYNVITQVYVITFAHDVICEQP